LFGADLFEDCFGELSFGLEQELAGIYDVRLREQTMKIIEIEREEVCITYDLFFFCPGFSTQITRLHNLHNIHLPLKQSTLTHATTHSHSLSHYRIWQLSCLVNWRCISRITIRSTRSSGTRWLKISRRSFKYPAGLLFSPPWDTYTGRRPSNSQAGSSASEALLKEPKRWELFYILYVPLSFLFSRSFPFHFFFRS